MLDPHLLQASGALEEAAKPEPWPTDFGLDLSILLVHRSTRFHTPAVEDTGIHVAPETQLLRLGP